MRSLTYGFAAVTALVCVLGACDRGHRFEEYNGHGEVVYLDNESDVEVVTNEEELR